MAASPLGVRLRAKKIGVLLRYARMTAGKSMEECAQLLHVPSATFQAFELGQGPPSLPDLEVLAYYLNVPIEHFWSRGIPAGEKKPADQIDVQRLVRLRQRVIGAILRQARIEAKLSLEEVSEQAGTTPEHLKKYELGEEPVPISELELLANVVKRPLKDFMDNRGPIGSQVMQQRSIHNFAQLTPELQEFISKPVNRPFLELAQRLSKMSVEDLRAIAEGLLAITF